MIISFLGLKGGTGKSTLARPVAVEFARNGWDVHVADMDTTQQTAFDWATIRTEADVQPSIEAALYRDPKTALKAANLTDLLIVDGKAFADSHAMEVAKASDLIVIPVGISRDDLNPTLLFATDLVNKGISRDKLFFVVSKVPEGGDKEAMTTRESIKNWGFEVATGWLTIKTGYSQAMDTGRAITETRFKTLNERTDKIIQQIFDKATAALEPMKKGA